jgi:signal transduction histidine kinase/DNA-binding response OmpR family regulator/HPt (histidine-containing phosphotransfer) domain-containing protein
MLVGIVSLLLSITVSFFASLGLERPYKQISEMVDTLKVAQEEALASTAAKSSFLANMSHEMRTPLNAIIGFSELALGKENAGDESAMPGEVHESFEKIYTSGVTLLGLINDILDISKIESGKLELIQENYDLPSLINDTMVLNMVRIGSKPITFKLDIDENLPSQLCGDELRIKQLMNNFLSNAFKYTEEGAVTLRISCQKAGEIVWMECSVSDTGKGIHQEDLDKLFSNYSQVDIKKNRGIEGTGLGLALTKRLVEMMGGTTGVDSVYGKGSTFSFKIQQGFVTDIPIGKELVDNLQNFKYVVNRRTQNTGIVRHFIPYAKVLVVDDVVTNLEVARGMLKPYGMTVDCVDSGVKAVQAIRDGKVKYNAVFMDHQMPGMDGIEAVRIIRNEIGSEYAKTVPIIALTANAIMGNDMIFLKSGFQAFLTKPIDIRKLNEAVNRWVRDKEYEKTLPQNQDQAAALENSPEGDTSNAIHDAVINYLRDNTVEGIYFEKALKRFGTGDIWLNSVRAYATSTPALLKDLGELNQETLEHFRITVHGIKGSSYAIAAEEVGRLAEDLEKAARNGDMDFIHSRKASFIRATEELIGRLKDLVEWVDENFSKPKKPAPDREILDRMLEATASYDIIELDKAIEELEKYQYETQGDIVLWLKNQIALSGFEQIQERLSAQLS